MSKITREAAERCAARTNAQQLAEYRRVEELNRAIKTLEDLLRERRKRKMTIDFPDRRGESDDFGHGL